MVVNVGRDWCGKDQKTSMQEDIFKAFFAEDRITQTLVVLCKSSSPNMDPISGTIVLMLSVPVHFCLTSLGLQLFLGKDITYPFDMMTQDQRSVIREALEDQKLWTSYEYAISMKSSMARIKPIELLYPVCKSILDSQKYEDRSHRVAVCNIILQRVQASIPLDKQVQADLNKKLFSASPDIK